MKRILFFIVLFSLTSCGMTQQEMLQKKEECKELGFNIYISSAFWNNVECYGKINNPIMDCIKEYTNGIDEKYNNPDIVTNLREDEYSNVVRICNEVFNNKLD